MRQIWSLQYLRAFAALGIVLFHVLEETKYNLPIGDGVDIFFVLSGYLVFAIIGQKRVTPLLFMAHRLSRLVPVYWIATFAAFVCACISPKMLQNTSPDIGVLVHALLLLPYAGPDGQGAPTLFVGWTLNYEMFFYVAFACLLPFTIWRQLRWMTVLFTALIVAGVAFDVDNALWGAYTNPLLLEFLAGAWMGCLLMRDGSRTTRLAAVLAVVAVLFVCGQWLPVIRFGWPAAALVGGAVLLEEWLPRIRALKWLGDASYSIYLFQQFGFDFITHVLHHASRATGVALDADPVRLPLEFVTAVALGLAAYELLEKPMNNVFRPLVVKYRDRGVRQAAGFIQSGAIVPASANGSSLQP